MKHSAFLSLWLCIATSLSFTAIANPVGLIPQGPVATPTDLSQKALIQFAIEQAPTVRQASKQLSAVEFIGARVEADRGPRLTGTVEALTRDEFNDTAEVILTQPLYSFGRQSAQEKVAAQQAQVAASNLALARRDAAIAFIDTYYDWWLSEQVLAERRNAVTESEELLSVVGQQRSAGVISSAQQVAAQLEYDRLRRAMLNAETDAVNALAELEYLLNTRLSAQDLARAAGNANPLAPLSDQAIESMIQRDPELGARAAELAVLDAEFRAAQMSERPVINGLAKLAVDQFTTGNSTVNRGVGVKIEMNFSAPGALNAKLGEIDAQRQAKLAEYEATWRDVRSQLKRQQRTLETAIRRAQTLAPVLERAQQTLESNRRQFSSGTADWRAYMASIAQLSDIRQTLIEARSLGQAAMARFDIQQR